jgi:hypothetical protein
MQLQLLFAGFPIFFSAVSYTMPAFVAKTVHFVTEILHNSQELLRKTSQKKGKLKKIPNFHKKACYVFLIL